MKVDVKDYRYKWAKELARRIEDDVEDNADELNDGSVYFEKLLIKNILEHTYQTSN